MTVKVRPVTWTLQERVTDSRGPHWRNVTKTASLAAMRPLYTDPETQRLLLNGRPIDPDADDGLFTEEAS